MGDPASQYGKNIALVLLLRLTEQRLGYTYIRTHAIFDAISYFLKHDCVILA